MKNTMLCFVNVLFFVCGQILFKLAARGKEISSPLDTIKLLFSPYMIAAIAVYAGATLLWVYILTKVPISYAYPIQALAFPLVLVFAMLVFKETIPITRWIGIAVILTGVFITAR